MPITNQKDWDVHVENNQEPYGKCCVDVARQVMLILDKDEAFDPHSIIGQADDEIKAGGITGFMAGAVASMVSQCHSRGAEFQKAWNAQYDGIGGEQAQENDSTVNPALMTVAVK